jgi:hypothetical protein
MAPEGISVQLLTLKNNPEVDIGIKISSSCGLPEIVL